MQKLSTRLSKYSKMFTIFVTLFLVTGLLPIALNIQQVQADAGGTGKYLKINIEGKGYVTATKVKSEQVFTFNAPSTLHKVGAGTVLLEAHADPGWEFSHWGEDLPEETPEPTEYKTVKYGEINATFVKILFYINVTRWGGGTIRLNNVDVSGEDGVVVVVGPFEIGATPTFTFVTDVDNYVSSIAVTTGYLDDYVESYQFPPIDADQTLDVYFSVEGTAFVPPGDAVVFLSPSESMEFTGNTGVGGTAAVTDLEENIDYPVGTLVAGWIIDVDFTFSGQVNITLQYNHTGLSDEDQENLRLIRGETLEALRSDVNGDLVVNGDDVSDVAWLNKEKLYEPWGDVNNDGVVDEKDIHIVNENKGAVLEDITDGINTDLHLIWGTTDQFSIFGCW